MSGKPALCDPLTFPISRDVLWDHRDVGPPAVVNITHCRLIHVKLYVIEEYCIAHIFSILDTR